MSSRGIASGTLAYASRKLLGNWFPDGFSGYRTQILAWIGLNTIFLLIYVVDGVIDEGWGLGCSNFNYSTNNIKRKYFEINDVNMIYASENFFSVLTWISGFYVGSDCCKNVVLTFNTIKAIF